MSKRNIESIVSDRVSLLAKCKKENVRFFELFDYEVGGHKVTSKFEGLSISVGVSNVNVGCMVVDGFGGLILDIGIKLDIGSKLDVIGDVNILAESVSEFNKVRASLESYFKADFALRHELARLRYEGQLG